jgi:DNA-binding response OmpR family regulator
LFEKIFKIFFIAIPGYDVYFINPHPQLAYFYYNCWEQGEYWHEGLKKLSAKILKELNILYIEPIQEHNIKMSEILRMKSSQVFSSLTLKDATTFYNTEKIDIIIMEINYPNENPFLFLNNLRKINRQIPIIIVSGTSSTDTILESIPHNIIDYIVKPVDLKKLKLALYRAVAQIYDNGMYVIKFENNLVYDVRKKILKENEQDIDLGKNELKLLDILVANKNALMSTEEIKRLIWDNDYEITEQALKSLINRLRTKIGKKYIKNVSTLGYILEIK